MCRTLIGQILFILAIHVDKLSLENIGTGNSMIVDAFNFERLGLVSYPLIRNYTCDEMYNCIVKYI